MLADQVLLGRKQASNGDAIKLNKAVKAIKRALHCG